MEILKGLNEDKKTTIIMVTHDSRMAEKTGKTIRLFDGRQVVSIDSVSRSASQAVAV